MGVDCNYVYGIVSLTPPKTLGFILGIHIKKKLRFTLKNKIILPKSSKLSSKFSSKKSLNLYFFIEHIKSAILIKNDMDRRQRDNSFVSRRYGC